MKYYVSYEYTGNKEKQIDGFKDWIIYRSVNSDFNTDNLMELNNTITKEIMSRTNQEYEDIYESSIIIYCIKELEQWINI